ncbi:putative transcriptional regulator,tetratricopeptide repeat protein,protein kinase family protein [Pleurocapsa sp. PCC 7327]|uniref:serine/threonine-protein kinase n=1 Tax=Pleurocapsa sp. PCC 7327 TaxID=118163 RepID=UPI00029FE99D|nr:serine/threonine-protein kinase [Pleurocapsa sp. PCC 7327]AFY79092.1 putative transcriptional regulator,tetratricopeptide repeat protein,protein kinase family protein [Pleurocapsa sp. PCC 7327]
MPELGEIIGGRYQILQELGSGGFSKTYLAKDTELPNQPLCVVKQLQLRFNSASLWQNAKERFSIEAQVLQRLGNHDRIPQVLAYLEEDGEFYLIQEFIDGEEFRIEVGRQTLEEVQVTYFLKEVLEILAFVHQQGVIHRDIKPSNLIRRRRDNKIVLIDFGAVKEIGTLSFDAQTQAMMTKAIGTPGYMSPEQQNGKPVYSSDIYALGKTAIYALTARSPLELEDMQSGALKDWERLTRVSPQLAAILNKMIRPNLKERYHSVAEVLQDLQPLLKIGQTVGGRYKISRYLGGEIGSHTYLAENLVRHYQSPCILKQLQSQTSDPSILEDVERLFADDLAVLEDLGNHPQISHLWDCFEEGQDCYIVREFIDGEALSQEIQRNQHLSEETVIAVLHDVLEVLAFVHQQGVIHRNIKPSNLVRRRQDNKIVLTDFGLIKEIAKRLSARSDSDSSDRIVGTKGYMPPEQMAGRPTYSSDIYALGMTAIQALTGTSPEQLQTDPKTGEAIWHENVQISQKLAKIIDKMVKLDVNKRYSSANKVLNALGESSRFLTTSERISSPTSTSRARRETAADLADRFARGRRRFLTPWYLLVIVAGIGFLLGVIETIRPTVRPMLIAHQGDRLMQQEKPEAALPIFQQVLDISPNNLQGWQGRGEALFALERYQEALAAYDKAIELQPRDARAWKGRGDVLYRLERYEAALSAYNKSLSLKPRDPEALNRKGRALYKLERPQEALAVQEEALRIRPNYAEALSDKGIALIGLRRYEEALGVLNKAQEIKPLDPKFWQNKALALQYLGRRKEALDVYQEALAAYDKDLERKPNNVTVWVDRGNVLIKLQRPEDALASYEKALKIKPDSYLAWLSKGNALFPLGRYDEVLTAFDKALEIRPESYLTWHNRGSLLRDGKKDFAGAIESYDRAIAISPNFYHAWRDRGLALSQANRHKDAIASFDRALQIEPSDHQSWSGRGIALSSLNRRAEALASFNKAVGLQPSDPFVWMNRGLALERWGRFQEARDSYMKARDLDPRFQPAINALERLQQIQGNDNRSLPATDGL